MSTQSSTVAGDPQAEVPVGNHVDTWLDYPAPTALHDPDEAYARWWLEHARMPAWKRSVYDPIMAKHMLFAWHNGELYRVTGASRFGDIWLAKDLDRKNGYDLRVLPKEITSWSQYANGMRSNAE
jgi:hypothetical protein